MLNHIPLSPYWTKRTTLACTISAVVTLTGCASLPEQVNSLYEDNKGAVIGAATGSIVAATGCALKGENIATCAIIGAVAGGIGGHLWDLRQKKLQEAAEKHNLTITTETVSTRNDQYIAADTKSDQPGSDEKNSMSTVIKDSGMFATGSSKLNQKSIDAFEEIAKAYKANDVDTKILIIGHTDGTGSAEFNQQLSEKRARNVAKLFIDMDISEDNIYYQGAGESRPIASNNSLEGRQQNRRVEIVETDSEASLVSYNIAKTLDKKNLLFTDIDTHKKATKKSKPAMAILDFGGVPVNSSNLDFYSSVVAAPKSSISIPFITTAIADDPGSPTPVACYKDAPRISGSIKKASNASKVDTTKYAIREHVPGLAESAVQTRVNGHNVGLGPVSVLKNTYTSASSPRLFLYKNDEGSSGKADFKYQTVINTYEGIDNFLYRVFVVGEQPAIQCIDLLYPKDGGKQATAGAIFYQADGYYTAEFRPVKL